MINGSIRQRAAVSGGITAGGGGTNDYTELENKPAINGNTLEGDKTAYELGLVDFAHLPRYQIVKNVLYRDTAMGANSAGVNIDYENNYRLSDYDLVIVNYGDSLDPAPFSGVSFMPASNNEYFFCGYGNRVNRTLFSDTYFNQISLQAWGEDSRYAPHVYEIIGYKLGAVV